MQTGFLMAPWAIVVAAMAPIAGRLSDSQAPGLMGGIGLVILSSQLPGFLGLPALAPGPFHLRIAALLNAIPAANPATTLLAIASLLLMLYGPRLPGLGRVPGPLLAMLAATLVQAAWSFDSINTVGKAYGAIPAGLPPF